SVNVELLQDVYRTFEVAARLVLRTCGKRLSCRVVPLLAVTLCQQFAQLSGDGGLVGEVSFEHFDQVTGFAQQIVPDGVVAGRQQGVEASAASSERFRLPSLLRPCLSLEEQKLDVRVFIGKRACAPLPGVREIRERLHDVLGVSDKRLGGAPGFPAEGALVYRPCL